MNGLVRLNEVIVSLKEMQVIDLAELFLPDDLVVIEGTLLLICPQMEVEKRLNLLHEGSK